ncbi:trypsin-2-like [Schistocerca nitens]|uniref:trypsin-2-like n=1 Tax=Schistocerca nitens TaxID=7011 RepID=UPI0021183D44|nr:trypsin-2-like [Schistocerca nitens]
MGGSLAAEGEFPFMMNLLYYGNFMCGGSILSENWALSSGFCTTGATLEALFVHAGSTTYGPETGVVVGVNATIFHENFDEWSYWNDICLLKLIQPLTFSSTIQPVSLPAPGQQTAAGTIATVVGWGSVDYTTVVVSDLHKVDVPVWSDEDCQATYDYYVYSVRENNICAGEEGKGKCGLDSGDPLLVNGQLVGIASWDGYECATADSPGVYTEVSYFVDWINQNAV